MNREREMETEKGSRKWIRGTSEIKQGFTPLLRTVGATPEHECHIEYLCTLVHDVYEPHGGASVRAV
jgi:hypothetical protein